MVLKLFCVFLPLILSHFELYEAILYGHEDDRLNLFENHDFEKPNDNHWRGSSNIVSIVSNGCYTGKKCAYIKGNRKQNQDTLKRTVTTSDEPRLKADTIYYLSAYVRMADLGGARSGKFRLFYEIKYNDGEEIKGNVGILPYQTVNGRWKQIGGDLKTRKSGFPKIEIWLQAEPKNVAFYLDTMALTVIPSLGKDWSKKLDEEIELHRTSTLSIKSQVPSNKGNNQKIEVEQLKLGFMLGSTVKPELITGNSDLSKNYRNFIKNHFKFAVFANKMKWVGMEGKMGSPKTQGVPEAMDWLEENGLAVHGHNILWEPLERNPRWLNQFSGQSFSNKLFSRVDYMLKVYGSRVHSWDLLNEMMQTDYYESKTGDNDILAKIVKRAKQTYPSGEYCISDYLIVRLGWFASAMVELAKDMKAAGGEPNCLGLQSHLRQLPVAVEQLKKRIEIVSQAGLPLIVTELSVHTMNLAERAEYYAKALKVYYANPNVTAVNTWGFCDVHEIEFTGDSGFTTGNDFKLNAAGKMIFDLIHGEWKSDSTYSPKSPVSTKSVKVHHGEYEVRLLIDGKVEDRKTIVVDKSKDNFDVTLKG